MFQRRLVIKMHKTTGLACLACAVGAMAAIGIAGAQTAAETVIHTFGNFPWGANPYSTLVRDAGGNVYGTTYQGGAANLGVVFRLSASGYKLLYSFQGGSDGANPYAGVALDSGGNLYGTTYQGGAANAGVVYKLEPSGQETVLYNFTGGADGGNPYGGVTVDAAGNLYGTAYKGGTAGAGVVYRVTSAGQETVLYSFTGGSDGGNPYAGVIADPAGNLYGTAVYGGVAIGYTGYGVVYKVTPSGQETVLYSFTGNTNGGYAPYGGVIRDAAGNLYGATSGQYSMIYQLETTGHLKVLYRTNGYGPTNLKSCLARDAEGSLYGTASDGLGAVFKLDTAGKFKVLYSFPGGVSNLGAYGPNGGVILDPSGNVYGATAYGGVGGMLYRVSSAGAETMLYSFKGAAGGTTPFAGVTRDSAGNLYGTSQQGGPANAGVLYEVDSSGREVALYSFLGGADGAYPESSVVLDSAGNVYGVAERGGAANQGVVYKVDSSGHETVLYNFTGGADGGLPNGVVLDTAGDLYGTTFGGGAVGAMGAEEGVMFKLDQAGHETVLYSFTGGSDGCTPNPGLTLDSGNLLGTTFYCGAYGAGVVYEITTAGQFRVLHSFTGPGPGGGNPSAGVILDSEGNLYGTAAGYGELTTGQSGAGVVFELDAAGQYRVLYTFTGGADGAAPGSLVRGPAGNLYGTALGGLADCFLACGVLYRVDPSGRETVLHSFTGGIDGNYPNAGLIPAPSGELYGTTAQGGAAGGGVLYKLTLQ